MSFTQAAIEVKLNGALLHTEYVDFVASFGAGDTIQFKYAKFFPSYVPPGSYSLNMYFKNGDSVNGCVSFSFKI